MKSLIEKYNKQLNSLNKDSDNYLAFKKEIIYKYRENLEFYIFDKRRIRFNRDYSRRAK